jgi:O-antigen/teichoic acid export membrane protein
MALRENFVWAAIAAASQALYGWAILGTIAKLQDPSVVGIYALSSALVTPLLALTGLQLRDAFITDTTRKFTLANYLGLRASTLVISLFSLLLIGYLAEFRNIIFLSGLAVLRSGESFAEMLHAILQREERMTVIALLSVSRHLLTTLVFGASLLLFDQATIAIWIAALASLLLVATVDSRASSVSSHLRAEQKPIQGDTLRKTFDLAIAALPLGAVLVANSLTLATPRYFLAAFTSPSELGIFAALHSVIGAFYILQTTIGAVTMPRLALSYARGDYCTYRKLGNNIVLIGAALSGIICLISYHFGAKILAILFTSDYATHSNLFSYMALASVLTCAYGAYAFLLNAMRCFKTNLIISAVHLGSTVLFCSLCIERFGVLGAIGASGVSSLLALVLSVTMYQKKLNK